MQGNNVVVLWRFPDVLLPISHEHCLLRKTVKQGSKTTAAITIKIVDFVKKFIDFSTLFVRQGHNDHVPL